MLVAQVARDGDSGEFSDRLAVDLARALDRREHGARHAHNGQHLVVPVERAQVHEHGPARVRNVGDVHARAGAAGQVPDDPAVDRAEQEVARFGLLSSAGNVVEQPANLGAGEVGRQRQPHSGAEAVLAAVARKFGDERVGSRVLPHDGVVDRLPGSAIPHDRRLALVSDPDRGQVACRQPRLGQRPADHFPAAGQYLERVVLDPAGPRVDLLVLPLVDRDDCARMVEHDEARARRALVECTHVLRHHGNLRSSGCFGCGTRRLARWHAARHVLRSPANRTPEEPRQSVAARSAALKGRGEVPAGGMAPVAPATRCHAATVIAAVRFAA